MKNDELQAALDAATATLASDAEDDAALLANPRHWMRYVLAARGHARRVVALVAEVSALRDESHGPNPCGAHGCTLAPSGGGQRVNGGCRCSAAALRLAYLALRKERDEARARIARYVAALDERHAAECDALHDDPAAKRKAAARIARACDECDYARVALRETPAGEGER